MSGRPGASVSQSFIYAGKIIWVGCGLFPALVCFAFTYSHWPMKGAQVYYGLSMRNSTSGRWTLHFTARVLSPATFPETHKNRIGDLPVPNQLPIGTDSFWLFIGFWWLHVEGNIATVAGVPWVYSGNIGWRSDWWGCTVDSQSTVIPQWWRILSTPSQQTMQTAHIRQQ